jgi:short subunit dehydrogenase-like uncharacterized protein
MAQPDFDVVVFGATSFVGQIMSAYLAGRHGATGGLRWAMAGRSQAKLEQLRGSLGTAAAGISLIVADAADEAALRAMCGRTRVVASTVGPYALYGSPLVKVCAETGTDYCDLTGEVQWIARMVAAHEATAKKSGARIVHCSGFDSIPSDLGVHVLQREARARFGAPCTRVRYRVKAFRGKFSGGTVASLLNVLKESQADPAVRKLMEDPYSVTPRDGVARPVQPDVRMAELDPEAGAWVAPFIMAAINTRIVHRSNALSGMAYGKDFRYDEAVMMPNRAVATATTIGMAMFMAAAAFGPTRSLLESYVVPKPGEGPTPAEQQAGFYDIRLFGTTAKGEKLQVKVHGDRDPGYGSTGKMLGEAAACLALDIGKSALSGGFWTPATAYGDKLVARLGEFAGVSIGVV